MKLNPYQHITKTGQLKKNPKKHSVFWSDTHRPTFKIKLRKSQIPDSKEYVYDVVRTVEGGISGGVAVFTTASKERAKLYIEAK